MTHREMSHDEMMDDSIVSVSYVWRMLSWAFRVAWMGYYVVGPGVAVEDGVVLVKLPLEPPLELTGHLPVACVVRR